MCPGSLRALLVWIPSKTRNLLHIHDGHHVPLTDKAKEGHQEYHPDRKQGLGTAQQAVRGGGVDAPVDDAQCEDLAEQAKQRVKEAALEHKCPDKEDNEERLRSRACARG